jgi:hypothetical protein
MYEEVKKKRREARKRTLPKTPPLLVLVRFVMPDGSVRGDKKRASRRRLEEGRAADTELRRGAEAAEEPREGAG